MENCLVFQQYTHGNEIHVGDGVLKAGCDKSCNGNHNSDDFTKSIFAGHGEPYSQADKPVTENPTEKRFLPGKCNLRPGSIYRFEGDRSAVGLPDTRIIEKEDDEQCTDKVEKIDPTPVIKDLF